MTKSPQLLELVRQVSRQRSLSRKTENAYLNHIRRLQNFYAARDLAEVGTNGINTFLNHLTATEHLAVSTLNQALSALSFLYREVFGQTAPRCLKAVKHTKPNGKLPVIFTPEEARAVLSKLHGDCFLAAALMYGSGLRLSEAVALRVGDIDFEEREKDAKEIYNGSPMAEYLLNKYEIEYVLISPEEFSTLEGKINEAFFEKFPVVALSGGYRVHKIR